MTSFYYTLLLILWMMFGSFSSVIIHRLKSGESGIWTGRSHCKTCSRNLSALELLPVLSWIFQKGRCRGCKQKISALYPILEISSGLLFCAIWVFLTDSSLLLQGNFLEIIKLGFFLFIGFLTIIYVFYDILFLEIPEGVLLTWNIFLLIVLSVQSVFPELQILPTIVNSQWELYPAIAGILLAIWIIWVLYYMMLAGKENIHDIAIIIACIVGICFWKYIFGIPFSSVPIMSGIIGALGIFLFLYIQILVSGGAWMWGGDLRIALLMWMTLGITFSFSGVMLSYFIWSIISIGLILVHKVQWWWKKNFEKQVPFGPFLAAGYFWVLFFSQYIESIMRIYL